MADNNCSCDVTASGLLGEVRKFLGEVQKITVEVQSHPRGGVHLPPQSGLDISPTFSSFRSLAFSLNSYNK